MASARATSAGTSSPASAPASTTRRPPTITVSTGSGHGEKASAATRSLPAPGSQPNRTPVPWDPAHPYQGLGFRRVDVDVDEARYALTEFPVVRG